MAKQKQHLVKVDVHGGIVLKAGVPNRLEWPADPRFTKDCVASFQSHFVSLRLPARIENAGSEDAVFVCDFPAEETLFPQRESRYVLMTHDADVTNMTHRGFLHAD